MEMELCQGEIQAHCTDVLNESLALIHSALGSRDIPFIRNNIKLTAYNSEQYNILNRIIDDIMTTFTDYYYVAGDNYLEHPYYGVTLYEGEELKDYHKNYFDNNPLFKVEYETLSDTTTNIMFSIKDKKKCLQALDEYCSSYGYDMVFNNNCNLLTCEAQNKQLYNLLTENEYNLNNFIVNDFKYIKALCYNEYLGKLFIANEEFDFNEDNKLIFKCTVNCEGFVESYGKTDTENIKQETQKKITSNKPRKHFSPSVQDLYNYIKTYAKARDYMIFPYELIGEKPDKLYENMGTLTTMVNRLNEQYREICHDESVTLMKYDKTLECYMITDIWDN